MSETPTPSTSSQAAPAGQPTAPATTTTTGQPAQPAGAWQAELDAMINARVEAALAKRAEPKAEPPKVKPPKAAPKSDDAPEWAKDLISKVDTLERLHATRSEGERRNELERLALAGVPEELAPKARRLLRGELAERGVDKMPADIGALAQQVRTSLESIAPELWRVPGSPRSALPRLPTGNGIDWASVQRMEDVPAELIKDVPPEHQRRLIEAATSGQSSDQPWAGGKLLQIKQG